MGTNTVSRLKAIFHNSDIAISSHAIVFNGTAKSGKEITKGELIKLFSKTLEMRSKLPVSNDELFRGFDIDQKVKASVLAIVRPTLSTI